MSTRNTFAASYSSFEIMNKSYSYYRISYLEEQGYGAISRLPYCMKVIVEAALREYDGKAVTNEHILLLSNWTKERHPNRDIPFKPARILLHDTTGLPTLVDMAAMREAVKRYGGDVEQVNPFIPVDLVVDHSVTVDYYGTSNALALNEAREFERNDERFRFFKWAQQAFRNVRIVPPSTGIMHQINMEFLSSVAATKTVHGTTIVYPDSLVGTDSHTTMINGLGIVAWGVGGIEAEAAMLDQPLYFVPPEVLGFKLTGRLSEGVTSTDLALTVTQLLRKKGVIGKFVEFFGPGAANMSVAERATIANMAPEYGATMGYFPVDSKTIDYLRFIGRSEELLELIETYYRKQGMFMSPEMDEPVYSDLIELDLSTVVPCLAGPKRPQDRVELSMMKEKYLDAVLKPFADGGFGLTEEDLWKEAAVVHPNGEESLLQHGSVVLAAITSCTNTSNPSVLIGAGLLARNAVERGLSVPEYVKTSLTPGSRVVTDYLINSGLLPFMEGLGFHIAGYGCATCIGNSGPLPDEISEAIINSDLVGAAVLSGNRNFEGRVHPQIKANYLASPPLVIAYALAGKVTIDLTSEPLGFDPEGQPVFLKDIWPTSEEIESVIHESIRPELYKGRYDEALSANKRWNETTSPTGSLFQWDADSTYIQEPPFLSNLSLDLSSIQDITDARVLLLLGDSVTTDHASPSGSIKADSPAGLFLKQRGVPIRDFNSYPSRRGNHQVMIRGAFANVRIRNKLVPGVEGGMTKFLPTGEFMSVYDASLKYKETNTSLIIVAGKEYGTGSSRDWAAKGPFLLGVRMIIAESFERIHRSNLVGMGVLPLQFQEGDSAEKLGITGHETFSTVGLSDNIQPGQTVTIQAVRDNCSRFEFQAIIRLDNPVEVDYYRNGGIMHTVIRKLLRGHDKSFLI